MKLLFPVLALLALAACTSPEKEPVETEAPKTFRAAGSTARFSDWTGYYTSYDPSFGKGAFVLQQELPLETMPGNVEGNFSPDFDTFYSDLLIFSPDRSRYIDIDSYQWSLGEDGEIASSPDQEIDLVDVNKKTVTRIAFRGPSQWVENVFWKNDHTVCLLENSDERILSVTEIDLKKRTVRSYVYSDTLKRKSGYTRKRVEDATGKNLQ